MWIEITVEKGTHVWHECSRTPGTVAHTGRKGMREKRRQKRLQKKVQDFTQVDTCGGGGKS